jgi:hypothetical protein
MKVTLAQARSTMALFDRLGLLPRLDASRQSGLSWAKKPGADLLFKKAMNIEMEHGRRKFPGLVQDALNVTNDNLIETAKIVAAHLRESPRYYEELIKMESALEKSKARLKRK